MNRILELSVHLLIPSQRSAPGVVRVKGVAGVEATPGVEFGEWNDYVC